MQAGKSDIDITILGSGTCVPSLERSACSVMLRIGRSIIVIDTGTGTTRRLLQAGQSIFDITHVFYSHLHPDHSAELVPLLFSTRYPDVRQRKFPLTLVAGSGFKSHYKKLKAAYGHWIELPSEILSIIELNTEGSDSAHFTDFQVTSIPVEHNPESLAYRFSGPQGGSVVYSGDTDYSENLIQLARDADVLICEAALPDDMKVEGHLTPSQAGDIASRARVSKLVLTHFYPECDQTDIVSQCRKSYSGPLILARDLLTIPITAG